MASIVEIDGGRDWRNRRAEIFKQAPQTSSREIRRKTNIVLEIGQYVQRMEEESFSSTKPISPWRFARNAPNVQYWNGKPNPRMIYAELWLNLWRYEELPLISSVTNFIACCPSGGLVSFCYLYFCRSLFNACTID